MRAIEHNTPWWKRLLRSRLMLSINLVLVGFVGWSLAREVSLGGEVGSQLDDLETQIKELEVQRNQYSDIIGKLGDPSFVEREARLKLGYQKPGEQVLILHSGGNEEAAPVPAPDDAASLSNPQKWLRYFFGPR